MNDNELESFISEQSSAEDEDPREAKALRHANAFFDFVEIATFTVLIILVLSCFLFRHTIVDGGSMMNTLQNGQHLIISDFLYTQQKETRQVFVRRYFYNDSIADIADRFGMSDSKVKSMLHRTRLALKAYLEEHDINI